MRKILLKGKKSKQRVCKSFKPFPAYHSPYRNIGPTLRILPCTSGILKPLAIQRIFDHFISGMLSMNNWPIYFHNYILLILIKCNLRPRECEPFPFFTNSSLVQCSVEVILLQLMEKLHILFQLNGASSRASLMKLDKMYIYMKSLHPPPIRGHSKLLPFLTCCKSTFVRMPSQVMDHHKCLAESHFKHCRVLAHLEHSVLVRLHLRRQYFK